MEAPPSACTWAQPPISRHIGRLDDELWAQLLTPFRPSVELAPAGQAFLDEARARFAGPRRGPGGKSAWHGARSGGFASATAL